MARDWDSESSGEGEDGAQLGKSLVSISINIR